MHFRLLLLSSIFILAASFDISNSDSCEDDSHEDHHHGGHHGGSCPEGFRKFTRHQGEWCLRVFGNNGVTISEAEAQSECRKHRAVLSGVQTRAEVDYVYSQAISLLYKMGKTEGTTMIGLKRKPSCTTPGDQTWKDKPECQPVTTNSFYWTDENTLGWEGVTWDALKPDNAWLDQDCAFMYIFEKKNHPETTIVPKSIDDCSCDNNPTEAPTDFYRPFTYVCGRRATR